VLAADLGEVERHLRMELQVPGDRAKLRSDNAGLSVNIFLGCQGRSSKADCQETDAGGNICAHGFHSLRKCSR
jgi:hypothetical protein